MIGHVIHKKVYHFDKPSDRSFQTYVDSPLFGMNGELTQFTINGHATQITLLLQSKSIRQGFHCRLTHLVLLICQTLQFIQSDGSHIVQNHGVLLDDSIQSDGCHAINNFCVWFPNQEIIRNYSSCSVDRQRILLATLSYVKTIMAGYQQLFCLPINRN